MNYAEQQRNPFRHIVGLAVVVIFHIGLIYALVNGLGTNIIQKLNAPLETKIVEEKKPPPPDTPPPPPPPEMAAPPPPYIPPPEIQIQQPPPVNSTAISQVSRIAPPAGYHRTAPAQADHDVSEHPLSGDPAIYPESMQDAGVEGDATIHCDVDTTGHTSNCVVVSVHGGAAFGRAALEYTRRERYSPRTHNGQPIAASHDWLLKYRLEAN